MATLIPEYKFSDLVKVWEMGRLKELKNCEINDDGYTFTFVNGNTESSGFLRTQTEYNCQTANAVGGKTLEEILGGTEIICEECGFQAKSDFGLKAHMRRHKEKAHATVRV